ncbi:hypothetical protein [Acetobacter conturbans]|uniref:Uncharacterized protein n=1 Tax=Acetobacter conturbans TaxID=1737472 RepID=A0ABX0K3E9_9PROT|nr:hypothetical protein [Acetobacter conturbans]NHN89331.1 hypothetical protein [Acetobacter conturbans]
MRTTFAICFAASLTIAGVLAPAHAESLWAASGCGAEPSAPSLDVSTVDHYNASVDKVASYEKAARAYNGCVSKEATHQQTAISTEAKAKMDHIQEGSSTVQKRIAGNFTKFNTQLKAAGAKLGKPK